MLNGVFPCQTTKSTTPTAKRSVDIDASTDMPPAKKQTVFTAQDYVVPLNDRVPTMQRRSGRKSSWMPSNRTSSFASNSFLGNLYV